MSDQEPATAWSNAIHAFRLFHTKQDLEYALELLGEDVAASLHGGVPLQHLLWDLSKDGTALSMYKGVAPISFKNATDAQYQRTLEHTYRFAKPVGSPGSFGAAALVYEVYEDKSEVRPQIMKVAVADETYWEELRFVQHIQVEMLERSISPHFPIAYDWFITQQLFPLSGGWEQLYRLRFIEQIKEEEDKTIANANSFAGLITMEYGYLGAASPAFYNGVIDKVTDNVVKSDVIKMVLFQLAQGLCGLVKTRMQHRDISSVNIVFVDGTKRAGFGDAYRQPIVYRIEGEEYAIKPGFEMEQQLDGVFWMPLFIDFSLSEIIKKGDTMGIAGPVTRLFSRAPELLFIHENIGGQVEYTEKGDVFSTAISFVVMMLREDPFLAANNPVFRSRDFQRFESQVENTCYVGGWSPKRNQYISRFLCQERSYYIARYVWMLALLLGDLSPATFPNVNDTKLYRLLVRYIPASVLSKPGQLWNPRFGVAKSVGEQGMKLLRRMLAWNPDDRPSAFDIVQDPYFYVFRDIAAELSDEERGAVWDIDTREPLAHISEPISFPIGRGTPTFDHVCVSCGRASVSACDVCKQVLCGPKCLDRHECA